MHPLGSRETADNIFYNRRDDRRNRIFQFTDHFRLTDERHLLYKQVDLDLTIDIRPEITRIPLSITSLNKFWIKI